MNGAMGLVEPPGHHTQRGFKVINAQPSQMRDGVNICPLYSKLLEGAMLVGNSKDSVERYETYCGQQVSSTFAAGGMFPENTNVTAVTFCDFVFNALKDAIIIVKSVMANADGVSSNEIKRCEHYLRIWRNSIPAFQNRKRSVREMLCYVERLIRQIEIEAFGEKKSDERNQTHAGCKQRPDSPGLTGKVY